MVGVWASIQVAALSILLLAVDGGNVTASERQALADFYVAMNGSRWLNNSGWTALPGGGDPCNPTAVFGVTCTNTTPNHVGYGMQHRTCVCPCVCVENACACTRAFVDVPLLAHDHQSRRLGIVWVCRQLRLDANQLSGTSVSTLQQLSQLGCVIRFL